MFTVKVVVGTMFILLAITVFVVGIYRKRKYQYQVCYMYKHTNGVGYGSATFTLTGSKLDGEGVEEITKMLNKDRGDIAITNIIKLGK